ncbi:MAG: relaxase domain-containing protein [Actinobacteria bacterium]|nr:relaxase domain-containing protein [Actinomycetota bacterium]MCL6105655.1 relaxase domain-containing protein [Actinomycetota bacterium]
MLRIHKLTPGKGNGASYYTSLASTDLAAYYAGSGEAPGQWVGSGLEKLCLELGIDPIQAGDTMTADGAKTFEYLNSKQAPMDLFPPQRRPNQDTDGQWVSGYDFTFSAAKGLSMLATMTDDDDLRRAIYDAHEQAVRRTIEMIEPHICYGREGKGGVNLVKGDGLIASAFRHRTSRPGEEGDIPDPHLHTHVVANIVRHPDGTYGALDGRALTARGNALALSAGAMFAAEQRRALEERGVFLEWKTAGRNGLLEVAGIPDDLLSAFSTRRNQIETEMARAGLTSYASSDTAQRKTRKAKDKEVAASSDTSLAGMLRAKMLETPITDHRRIRMASLDDLHTALLQAPPDHPYITQEDLVKLSTQLLAPLKTFKNDEDGVPKEHLTAKHPTFTFWELVGAISRSAPYAAGDDVMAAAEKILITDKVIPLSGTDPNSALPWQQAYTTPEIITLENAVISMITAEKNTQYGRASKYLNIDGLSKEQTAMCKHLTGSGHQIDLTVGVAGSGKTYALQRCKTAWIKADYKVFGCAKSASAAGELEDGTGIRSHTIDKLLSIINDSIVNTGEGLPPKSVVVVDEAGTLAATVNHTV